MGKRAFDEITNLRKRLVSRGCALGIPALIGVLEADAQAAVPETLSPSLMALPKLAAAGVAAGTASANIIMLMEGALKTMAIAKIKMAGIGILVALLIGTTGVVVVRQIQKKQAPGTSEKSEQKVHDQPKSSKNDELASTKLETKDKTQPAKVKQPPRARNFQAEMEEALARSPKEGDYFSKLDTIMREWFDYDKDGVVEWTLRMTGEHRFDVLKIVASAWAERDPVAAYDVLMKLPEGKYKDELLNGVVALWATREPENAKYWIEKSSLPQDEKDKLLKYIPKK